jgi:transposase
LDESGVDRRDGEVNRESTKHKKRDRSNWNGRNSFDNYKGAVTHDLKPEYVQSGDICRCCSKGRLYDSEERKLLQFTGSAPVEVTRYKKQVLRCNACGAMVMNNANITKWTHSSRSSIVLQKTHGMPFNRLSKLQGLSGIPIAASTLWQQCLELWDEVGSYIYDELLSIAVECNSFNVDDTGAKILEVIKANKLLPGKERRWCNTTTICARTENDEALVLYITSNKHAGENIAPILQKRQNKRDYIQLITDASSNNKPVLEENYAWLLDQIITIYCLAHGQRKFTDIEQHYPEECGYFLIQTRAIYHNEHQCKSYSPEEKLKYHQEHSSRYINNIYNKIEELVSEKEIEPNSALGKAMKYWLNNKEGLTQFLRVAVISLDNNWAERSLRALILQRKNSFFFKTKKSAKILSGLHSIVKTCEENGINVFGYLNWLQDNWIKVRKNSRYYTPFAYAKYINNTELIAIAA